MTKRFNRIIFRPLLVLLSLELSIRLAEYGYYFYLEHFIASPRPQPADEFTVVCIGDDLTPK